MSYTFTGTDTATFTLTNAKHLAAKIATDLKRMQRFYGSPSDVDIENYEGEAIGLLKAGYLETVSYGFKRGDKWIEPTVTYKASDLYGATAADDDPGRISPGRNVTGATFYSFLTYKAAWFALSEDGRTAIKDTLPISRTTAAAIGVDGYVVEDRTYSSGGRALIRSSVKSL